MRLDFERLSRLPSATRTNGNFIFQRLMRAAGPPDLQGRRCAPGPPPHFYARGLFQQVEVDGQPLRIPALTPHLSATPGATTWPGPAVGAHNQEILGGLLGLSDTELAALQDEGVI